MLRETLATRKSFGQSLRFFLAARQSMADGNSREARLHFASGRGGNVNGFESNQL